MTPMLAASAHDAPPVLFFVVFGGVALYLILRVMKFGGLKAAMFGARIARIAGEVEGVGRVMNVSLEVCVLDGGADRSVGVALIAKSFLSYQMMSVALSTEQAKMLAEIVQGATQGLPS